MKELKSGLNSDDSSLNKAKTHSKGYANSQSSLNFNHQRVSVRDIIESHYRKGK